MSKLIPALFLFAITTSLFSAESQSAETGLEQIKAALLSDDPMIRLKACQQVMELKDPSESLIPIIVESASKPFFGEGGFLWLGAAKACGKKSIPSLLKFLKDSEHRAFALGVLASFGSDLAGFLPDVARLAESTNDELRSAGLLLLGSIGERAAEKLPSVLAALKSDQESVRMAAVDAVKGIGPKAAPAGRILVGMLLNGAQHDIWGEIPAALAALGKAGGDILPVLLENIESGNPETRERVMRAIAAMGKVAKRAEAKVLDRLLNDNSANVRWYAAQAVESGTMDSDAAIVALGQALDDNEPERKVRAAAAVALGRMSRAPTKVLDALIKACSTYDPIEKERYSSQIEVRRWAAKAIGNIGPKALRAIPVLTKLLSDESVYVRIFAAEALGKVGSAAKPALPALADALERKDIRQSEVEYIIKARKLIESTLSAPE